MPKLDDDITHFALKAFVCERDALASTDSEASLVFVSPTITCGIAELSAVLKWPNHRKLFTLTCHNRTPNSSGYCIVSASQVLGTALKRENNVALLKDLHKAYFTLVYRFERLMQRKKGLQ